MNMNLIYSTTDLFLATTISLYFPLDSVDKTNPHKSIFNFRRTDDLDKIIEMYWRRELKIEPQSVLNQLKTIKSRLYES